MDNYKTIATKLGNLETFRGNTLWARYSGPFNTGVYEVFSYSTLIATANGLDAINLDSRKYSVTTSKHQNIIRRAWGVK